MSWDASSRSRANATEERVIGAEGQERAGVAQERATVA